MSGLQKLRTYLRIASSSRLFQIVCGFVSGLLHSAVSVPALAISQTWLPTHGSREGSGLGCLVAKSPLSMNSGQCSAVHCSVAKFVLKTCVSVNLAYIE